MTSLQAIPARQTVTAAARQRVRDADVVASQAVAQQSSTPSMQSDTRISVR
jgi:hypothetical protein